MADKLIISFDEYVKIVEKLAIEIHKRYKPTVLVGIMRGAAPIIDILSRILKLPIAYIVIQSYTGKGMEDKQGQLMFAREISSLANEKDFNNTINPIKEIGFYRIYILNILSSYYLEIILHHNQFYQNLIL